MKIALVYDRINKWGGAERVLLALHRMFRSAPLYTSVYSRNTALWADSFDVRTSFLQKIPKASNFHEFFAPFMPVAFESMSFDDYDVVISVTSEAAKGIITKSHTLHICICLTPTRYIWSGYDEYFKNKSFALVTKPIVHYLRKWDKSAAYRPDYLVSISRTVQKRIKQYYGRDSVLIYPPVELSSNLKKHDGKDYGLSEKSNKRRKKKDYYLIVSRAVPYKRIDIAIEACNKLSLPLKIIGKGRCLDGLKRKAGKTVEFLGYVKDEELAHYYKNSKALIFPGIEDFGISMVEAQSFGVPVVAFKGGGAEEIILEGKTGELFSEQNADSLAKVLKRFDENRYNTTYCQENAERFSGYNFEKGFKNFFDNKVKEFFGGNKKSHYRANIL